MLSWSTAKSPRSKLVASTALASLADGFLCAVLESYLDLSSQLECRKTVSPLSIARPTCE